MADAILADASASGIYQIRNLRNGKRYIGSAVCFRKRWAVHNSGFKNGNHPNRFLMRSWSEHGADAFVFEIIETCAVEDLIHREQHWIDSARPEYNLSPTAGNCLGVRHSEEARRKRSELNRGNKFCVGRKPSAKCLAAVSAANRARKGYKRSPESVALTAAAHRGMKRSAETRRRISEARMGKKMPPRSAEHKAKLSAAMKKYRKNSQVKGNDQYGEQGLLCV
jgi:group I intron endonuclease